MYDFTNNFVKLVKILLRSYGMWIGKGCMSTRRDYEWLTRFYGGSENFESAEQQKDLRPSKTDKNIEL